MDNVQVDVVAPSDRLFVEYRYGYISYSAVLAKGARESISSLIEPAAPSLMQLPRRHFHPLIRSPLPLHPPPLPIILKMKRVAFNGVWRLDLIPLMTCALAGVAASDVPWYA